MSTDYLTIGSTPHDEECEQLGPNYDHAKAKIEMRAFINQIRRVYGEPPEGARLAIKGFPHDYGTYHEVCVVYNTDSEEACEYAYTVEADDKHGLATWDSAAKAELEGALRSLSSRQDVL